MSRNEDRWRITAGYYRSDVTNQLMKARPLPWSVLYDGGDNTGAGWVGAGATSLALAFF